MKKNCFEIEHCKGLFGEIRNQTSKNATLPIMAASLLCDEKVKITNVPNIVDVNNMIKILQKVGAKVKRNGDCITIDPSKIESSEVDSKLSKTMRSSIFLLGPLLAKFKKAKIHMPGGCDIGKRPIDIHINSLKRLGVNVVCGKENTTFKLEDEQTCANEKLKTINLKLSSVGATENVIMFASKRKGITKIKNAAREPEIVDLCNFLNQMGAKILGAGTDEITIYGVDKFYSTEYRPAGDRIVAGTIMAAVAVCGGDVTITNAVPYQNEKLIEIMRSMGCQIDYKNDIIHIVNKNKLTSVKKISTGFYPNFPTDMQSIMLAVCCVAKGKTTIKENVFENRFLNVKEMKRLGANITQKSAKVVQVQGVDALKGGILTSHDLRGGAALVIAGLCSQGKTIVRNIEFIDRGYDHLEEILNSLGAKIKRL